jgi:small-conductance mechanosensitive channel
MRSIRGFVGLDKAAPFALCALSRLAVAPALLAQPLLGASHPKPVDPHAAAAAAAARAARERALLDTLQHPGTWGGAGQRMLDRAVDFLPSLGAAIVVLLVFYALYRGTQRLLRSLLRRTHADPAVLDIGLKLSKFVILAFGLVMAAGQLGFQIASVLAGLGIVGLAVGLAAQDTLANLVAGITILWDRPFRIGDHVTVAGTYGAVQAIGLRTTRIRTNERIDAILPNKTIINEKILNHTRTPQLRLGIPVGIGYGEDLAEARRVLVAAVADHPQVLADPPPKMVVKQLGDSAVLVEVRVWLADPHLESEVRLDLLERVKLALDAAGIEIPFPTQTVLSAPPAGKAVGSTEDEGPAASDKAPSR